MNTIDQIKQYIQREKAKVEAAKYDPNLKTPDGAHNLAVRLQSRFQLEGRKDWRFMGVADRDLLEKTEREKKRVLEMLEMAVGALERCKQVGSESRSGGLDSEEHYIAKVTLDTIAAMVGGKEKV